MFYRPKWNGMENDNIITRKHPKDLVPGILYNLAEVITRLNFNDEQVKEFYLQSVAKIKLPHTQYTANESWNIVKKEMTEHMKKFEK